MLLFKGRDNVIEIGFGGVDLTAFNKIQVILGSDDRNSVDNPDSVIVTNATVLTLAFGDTTETGSHYLEIYGFDPVNVNGVELTSKCAGNLPKLEICEG